MEVRGGCQFYFEMGDRISLNLELTHLVNLSDQRPPAYFCLCLLTLELQMHATALSFDMGAESALDPLSQLLSLLPPETGLTT